MTTITIDTDNEIKEAAENLFKEMGLSLSGAVEIFFRQALRDRGLPFQPSVKSIDENYHSYFNEANVGRILSGDEQLANGQFVVTTLEELERMAQ